MINVVKTQSKPVPDYRIEFKQVGRFDAIESFIVEYSDGVELLVIDGPNNFDSINTLLVLAEDHGIAIILARP